MAVVLLTMYSDRQLVKHARAARISGFVLKARAGDDPITAIHRALAGETYVSGLGADAV